MNLQKVDEAIENLCDQLSDLTERILPACTLIEDAYKIETAAAEIGNSLATLLTARELYNCKNTSRKEKEEITEEKEKPIDWAKHL